MKSTLFLLLSGNEVSEEPVVRPETSVTPKSTYPLANPLTRSRPNIKVRSRGNLSEFERLCVRFWEALLFLGVPGVSLVEVEGG